MEILQELANKFWSKKLWLPPNTEWNDVAPGSRSDIEHADYRDLLWTLPLAIIVLIIRFCVEKYILSPLGKSIGIRSVTYKRAAPVFILEKAYTDCNQLSRKRIVGLKKQLDMSKYQIERWWLYRRAQDKPSTLTKFCENSWRCLYYTFSFAFGLYVSWDKPWSWNIKHCWYGHPHQPIDGGVRLYYMLSMSFYLALFISQFFDVKRKDFWQMCIHHVIALLLLSMSWISNLQRVGSLVLVVHDCADIFLEAAKITKYAKYQKLCDFIFAFFTLVWIVTRLGLFPRIIYSSMVEASHIMAPFPVHHIVNGLMVLLLMLHIVWTFLILKIVHNSLKSGQMAGDIRSNSSGE